MKNLILILFLFFNLLNLHSQINIILQPKELEVIEYNETKNTKLKKNIDTSFIIEINDKDVIFSTSYPKNSYVIYKIIEEVYNDEKIKILKCETKQKSVLSICYYDDTKENNCIWLSVNFKDTDFNYKIFE
jgi:hypothetical protein